MATRVTQPRRGMLNFTTLIGVMADQLLQLARAGFYFKPGPDNLDNCVCFICDRNLDGWEEGDNPFLEHVSHGPDCGWAINADITWGLANDRQVDEDPLCERLIEARTATFGDKWPHEDKRGWKGKVAKACFLRLVETLLTRADGGSWLDLRPQPRVR